MSNNTFQNKERTKWKILSFSLIGILIGSATTTAAAVFFQIPQQLLNNNNSPVTGQQAVNAPSIVNRAYGAGILTNVFALPADNLFSTRTYYTIAFTTATAGAIKEIEMTFPAGFNVANAKLLQVQGGIGAGSLSVSGQVVKYTVSSAVSVPASTAIKISIADITNAATTSSQVSVTTKSISGPNVIVLDGPTTSAPFTLVQISNAMLASNAITAPKIAPNSIDNAKILDGQVTLADLAANSVDANKTKDGSIGKADLAGNSVDGNKIVDGSIGKAEVSTAFIKKVSIPDQNNGGGLGAGGGLGWDPDSTRHPTQFIIPDTFVKGGTVISINLHPNPALMICDGTSGDMYGYPATIWIWCRGSPPEGTTLDYVLIN